MPNATSGTSGHEDTFVASAGEPAHESEAREVAPGQSAPTPEEFDAREEHFSGPRKAMGPTDDHDAVPPTDPDEQ